MVSCQDARYLFIRVCFLSGCKVQRRVGDPFSPEVHMVLFYVARLVLDTADCL